MTEFFKGDRVRLKESPSTLTTQVMNVVEVNPGMYQPSITGVHVRCTDSVRPYEGWYPETKLELVHSCSNCGMSDDQCDSKIRQVGKPCCPRCHSRDTHQLLTPDGSRKRDEPQIPGIAVDDRFYVNGDGEPITAISLNTARVTRIDKSASSRVTVTFLSGVGYKHWNRNHHHIANCIKFHKEHTFEEAPMPIHDTYTKSFAQDPNRGVTVATINIEGETITGSAKTAPKEHFDPTIGRLLAEARALESRASQLKHEANNLAGEKLTD